jgi:hypothetical protein
MLVKSCSTLASSGEMVGLGAIVGEGVAAGEVELGAAGLVGVAVVLAWKQAVQVSSNNRDRVLPSEAISATKVSMWRPECRPTSW